MKSILSLTSIAAAIACIAACAAPSETAIELSIAYEDSWEVTGLTGTAGSQPLTFQAQHAIEVRVPDAWAESELTIELFALRGTEAIAKGTAVVIPVRGETVTDSMALELLACATTCVEGTTLCTSDGVARCERGVDGCFAYGAARACSAATPNCEAGECVAAPTIVRPSNRAVIGQLEDTGLVLEVPHGSTFDTTTNCVAGSILGTCSPITQPGLPGICVCRADELAILGLDVRGARALALLVRRSVVVSGELRVLPGTGEASSTAVTGNAGGSHGTRGGGASAAPSGNVVLIPLVGGRRGGGPNGGAGGGALQITAGDFIRLEHVITSPGGGAGNMPCTQAVNGGGGGSGGSILMESRTLVAAGHVYANGGSAAGGNVWPTTHPTVCGDRGADGPADAGTPAEGGTGRVGGCHDFWVRGGNGGAGSIGDGRGSTGTAGDPGTTGCGGTSVGSGGGGGGAGRIRINTTTGVCTTCTGEMSPTPSFGITVIEPQ